MTFHGPIFLLITILLQGLHCADCASNLERALFETVPVPCPRKPFCCSATFHIPRPYFFNNFICVVGRGYVSFRQHVQQSPRYHVGSDSVCFSPLVVIIFSSCFVVIFCPLTPPSSPSLPQLPLRQIKHHQNSAYLRRLGVQR
jgi:hypothetical protein